MSIGRDSFVNSGSVLEQVLITSERPLVLRTRLVLRTLIELRDVCDRLAWLLLVFGTSPEAHTIPHKISFATASLAYEYFVLHVTPRKRTDTHHTHVPCECSTLSKHTHTQSHSLSIRATLKTCSIRYMYLTNICSQ